MANYTLANLTKYQAKILQGFNAGELRVRTPEVFISLRKNTELLVPSHKEIKNAAKRTTGEVAFMARSSRSLGTGGETYNHTGAKGDSNVIVPAWDYKDDKFTYDNKQANGSIFSLDEFLLNEMVNLNNNFSEGLEAWAASFVHTNRSGVNTSTAEGTFNATNDVFEITESFTNNLSTGYRSLQIITSNLRINKWSTTGNTIYCDTIGFNKMQVLAAQGSGNSLNTAFQFGGNTFIHSPELDALAAGLSYAKGYFVVSPDKTSAVLDWMPVQNRNGERGPDNMYGSMIHPSTGLPIAWHQYSARADQSGSNSENQSVKTEVQAFTYISGNTAPLTVADETTLYAFALV